MRSHNYFNPVSYKAAKGFSLLWIILVLSVSGALAQPGNKDWEKIIRVGRNHTLQSVHNTLDGGYIIGGDVSLSDTNTDYLIVKLDAYGAEQWHKTFGGAGYDMGCNAVQTIDGGYILGGSSASAVSGSKTTDSHGKTDFWVLKLDASGKILWQRSLGSASEDNLTCLLPTRDGGCIVGGNSLSATSEKLPANIDPVCHLWVVRLSSEGSTEWERHITGTGNEYLNDICSTKDNGFTIGGTEVRETPADADGLVRTNAGYHIIHLDMAGDLLWQRHYNDHRDNHLSGIRETTDGGYIVGGFSQENPQANGGLGTEQGDFQLLKLDASGKEQWERDYGNQRDECLTSICQTGDGGYMLGGYVYPDRGNELQKNPDFRLIKISPSGLLQWDQNLAGNDNNYFSNILETVDDGYILAGCNFQSNAPGAFNALKLVKFHSAGIDGRASIEQQLNVFVNPGGTAQISCDQGLVINQLAVIDVGGRVVMNVVVHAVDYTINTQALTPGSYILNLETNKGLLSRKLIIHH